MKSEMAGMTKPSAKPEQAALMGRMGKSLLQENCSANQKKWAQYIASNNIPLLDIVGLFYAEKNVSMRFTWMVGGLLEINPGIVRPAIPWFFSRRREAPFPNFDRSIAKMLWLAGVPAEIEGEATDQLFSWLMDPKIKVSTKVYAVDAIANMVSRYPDLLTEFKIVVADQMGKNTASFDRRAKCALARVEKK
jgi:hypothetical protein